MSFWVGMNMMEANSPVMEQLIMFYDYSMIIMFSILIFLLFSIMDMFMIKSLNLYLIEEQSVEMIWTVVPMILLIFIAAPSLRLLYLMEESFSAKITIKVIAHQWYWEYEYTDFKLEFEAFLNKDNEEKLSDSFRLLETDQYLILPVHFMVRFLVTSADVIHSWTVQSLGIKMDAIPGRLNQMSAFPIKTGLFFGQCSEICGSNHSFMPISLMVVEMEDFLDYLEVSEKKLNSCEIFLIGLSNFFLLMFKKCILMK